MKNPDDQPEFKGLEALEAMIAAAPDELAPAAVTADLVPTMSSLQIAEITGKEHRNVLADIRNVLAQAGIEAAKFSAPFKMPSGQSIVVFHLPRFECDLLMTGYSVPYRAAVLRRWQELESKLAAPSFNIPKTLADALRLYADQLEVNETKDKKIAADAPKVEFYDTVTESGTVCDMAVAAQVANLPFGRNTLFIKLREKKVLSSLKSRYNLPLDEFVQRGYFTVKENNYDCPKTGEPIVKFTTKVTQKGIDYLIRAFGTKGSAK